MSDGGLLQMKVGWTKGIWLWCLCSGFAAGSTFGGDDANQVGTVPRTNSWFESAKVDFANLPKAVIEESGGTFWDRGNMTALLLAGGASIAMHNSGADDNLAENFERHRTFHDFTGESLNIIGSPPTHFAATGLWYVVSAQEQDEFNKRRAWTMMTALSVNGLVVVGLKAIRHNDRPNGGIWSWPSGHTASSFTVASVLDEFYGPKVGIPAYALAGLVGYRMMDAGDHWGSDVLFGGTLGWVVGHSIAGRHRRLEVAGFEVLPYMANGNGSAVGISLMRRF